MAANAVNVMLNNKTLLLAKRPSLLIAAGPFFKILIRLFHYSYSSFTNKHAQTRNPGISARVSSNY